MTAILSEFVAYSLSKAAYTDRTVPGIPEVQSIP
jgi:hypothetical protein